MSWPSCDIEGWWLQSCRFETGAMDKPAIEIRDLVKSFPQAGSRERLIAVDHLSMTINRGEVVAFLGPNGAGKSTTVDMLLGMTRPDSGKVTVLGSDPRTACLLYTSPSPRDRG